MSQTLPILLLLLGIAIGWVCAWLVMRGKAQDCYDRGKSEGEAQRAALTERLDARQQTIDELCARIRDLEQHVAVAQAAASDLRTENARFATTLQEERKQADEKLAVLNQARQNLSDAFRALAAEALQSNNQSFLELAKASLAAFQEAAKGDLEKRQQAIDELVKPVQQSLEKVDTKIQDLEKARIEAYSGLTEQVKSLGQSQEKLRWETSNLVQALRTPHVRGRWGEMQLKRVVEIAGMLDHCDFYEQQTTNTEEGRLRPDMVIHLAGGRNIVVDSKVPLTAYLDAVEAQDEELRKAKLQDHARQVRTHISALSRKSYYEQFERAPEFAVLFLPGEAFFSAAIQCDPALLEWGAEQNVLVAAPTTLIALLRAATYGWKEERLARNAKQISDLGRELYERLALLGTHLIKVGKGLQNATDAYNKAVASLESRVFVSARKFKDLGATGGGLEIEELSPVEAVPRDPQVPELLTQEDSPGEPGG